MVSFILYDSPEKINLSFESYYYEHRRKTFAFDYKIFGSIKLPYY